METRGGLASLADIKAQTPLPETADELCAVAQDVKAEARAIYLGTKATEREVTFERQASYSSTVWCTSPPTVRWLAS